MGIPTLPNSVDAVQLRALLDGRWAAVRKRARRELHFTPSKVRFHDDIDTYRAKVTADLRELAATGNARLGFPGEYGGTDDIGGSVVYFEMLGFGDLSLMVKTGVQWGLFGGAVQVLGTRRHHERYLRAIMELALPGCFAMSETAHGSDVSRLRTTATYEPVSREFVVHTPDDGAKKDYIGNAARDGRMAVVFAQLRTGGDDQGVHALLVPIRDEHNRPMPGVAIEDCGVMGGLNGVDHGRLSFNHVRVPREALLNRFGDVAQNGTYTSPFHNPRSRLFAMLCTQVIGRISLAGGAGSVAKTALTIAIRYAETHRQFARPDGTEVVILDYLAHQRRLLPALATTYALHFAQEELVTALHEIQLSPETVPEERQRALAARAAGIKAITTWHTSRTIQECREACGGAGYRADHRLPQLNADTDVFTTFEGDNTVLLQMVARSLLNDVDRLPPPAAEPRPGPVDLLDRDWQLHAFADREQHVADGLARRLRRAGADEADAFEVFNNAQDHVLTAARVHVERSVLAAFVAAVERCADPAAAALLGRVCDLYVLSTIERDRAWFLEHGRLTASAAKQVTPTVNAVCRQLRPHAGTLVDAFAIPEHWLGPPIADPR